MVRVGIRLPRPPLPPKGPIFTIDHFSSHLLSESKVVSRRRSSVSAVGGDRQAFAYFVREAPQQNTVTSHVVGVRFRSERCVLFTFASGSPY